MLVYGPTKAVVAQSCYHECLSFRSLEAVLGSHACCKRQCHDTFPEDRKLRSVCLQSSLLFLFFRK